ncbi:MAG: GNAT family N-acetyltransferase [Desulfobacterales bacterium]
MTGYLHQDYANSLAEFGALINLTRCQGWILKRQIPGFSYCDAMGCYPFFACRNWPQLHADLEDLKNDLICLSIVTDPFGDYDETYLQRCFQDVVIPFKKHYIIDLNLPMETYMSDHHQRYSNKALLNVYVEKCENPKEFLDDWVALYENLIDRHNIKGITAFSKRSFAKQLNVPGIVAFRAVFEGTTIGMLLWFVQDEVGYYHLGAYNDCGYEMRASFALFRFAIDYFTTEKLQRLNLGAGAGLEGNGKDGLSRFKRGWSTGTQTVYFCGRIFNYRAYDLLVAKKGVEDSKYFPKYRQGEFG